MSEPISSKPHYIFVLDPMCSWCWGFHPVIEQIRRDYHDTYDFSLVMGGLRTKGAMVWDEPTKAKLLSTWQQVAETTGQHFNDNLFNRDKFDYDTYPACKAVVSVREIWGEDAAFEYLARVQEAFYAGGQDTTDVNVLTSLLDKDKQEAFLAFYQSQRAEVMMHHHFAKARSMGANVFPSVVKIDTEGHMVCKKGYLGLEELL